MNVAICNLFDSITRIKSKNCKTSIFNDSMQAGDNRLHEIIGNTIVVKCSIFNSSITTLDKGSYKMLEAL